MKKKTFLVTGGTGFIGSNISNLLVKKNCNVKIFDNNSRGCIQKIKNFKKINPVEIYCYDMLNYNSYWKRRIFNDAGASLYNLNFDYFKNTITRYFEFKKFFKDKSNFLLRKIIKENSLREILRNETKIKHPFFLKIDIEGSEYRLLNEIIELKNQLSGLIIEFHDLDLNLKKVEEFVKKIDFRLTHVHANNFSRSVKDIPVVLEMTFEKNPILLGENVVLPHELDQPNNPQSKEIFLKFNNLPI